MMRRLLVLAIALAVTPAVTACKGKTTYKDKQETLDALTKLQAQVDADKKLLDAQSQRLADCELKGAETAEVAITVVGDAITISGVTGKGPNQRATPDDPAGDAKDAELFEAFINLLEQSKGAIKKCYQNALKKDGRLQAKTIPLTVSASFAASGSIKSSTFAPSISDTFDSCMKGIAGKWKLPAAPKPTNFTAPKLNLTPT